MSELLGVIEQLRHGNAGAAGLDERLGQIGKCRPVALLEGRPLALAVIGEDDEVIWPRRGGSDAFEVGEDRVYGREDRERVVAIDPGVMGDLVIADRRCCRRPASPAIDRR